ncbi:hypothetical protein P691DRAFT_806431 [Macrolepiota fuliginosa MF-IS2]|uniref:Uncharacterized protein n=1 Tax=Macrolepiota fuliginosa MF-IS2 TaxID=1400762 RepID=A0A9P5X866_9AGAR|nr:hypothetical protein P691DRAFT_806431 [Macrolepiota fuliginosa MF-IS2]
MEVSPGDVLLPPPRRALKRSASTASLPTPPRTHRRHKRGRSRGDCDSDSDVDDALGARGSALLSSDEEDNELPHPGQKSRKKRRMSEGKGDGGDEEAFWLAGPEPEPSRHEDKNQGKASASDKQEGVHEADGSSAAPLLYRKSLRRSQSQGSNGLASPPPSHRKPQIPAPVTPPAGTPGPSIATIVKTQPSSSPKTPRKQTGLLLRGRKGPRTPEFPIISDSPSNPFYVVPTSPSPGEESESPRVDSVSPRTPGLAQYEKPTVTYVFRGVRREYQNPLYDHAKNRPLSPPPTSLLPIEHPDYSPDMGCRPAVLFPNIRKGKRPAAARGGSTSEISAPIALRRSPRRKTLMAGDSDDEDSPTVDVEEQEEEDEESLVKPRKLDFGKPKNVTGATMTSTKITSKPKIVGNDSMFRDSEF